MQYLSISFVPCSVLRVYVFFAYFRSFFCEKWLLFGVLPTTDAYELLRCKAAPAILQTSSSYTAKNGSCIRSSDDNANRGTEPALFIVISAFDRSCDHTLDDLSAECKVQNHDRRHGQQHCRHLLWIV